MLGSIEGACSINHRGDLMEKTGTSNCTLRYTLRLHRVEKIVIEFKKSNEKEYSMTSNQHVERADVEPQNILSEIRRNKYSRYYYF